MKEILHFLLEKIEKNSNFCFSKNGFIWLLMVPNASLSTPRTSKHLLEAPTPPRDTSKKFSKNRFLNLKLHFSSVRVLRAWKNVILSNFSLSKFSYSLLKCLYSSYIAVWLNLKYFSVMKGVISLEKSCDVDNFGNVSGGLNFFP